jgi:Insecticide toxin TcdB middle/N-terminal region/Salmonella virulence plasmid 65kDa B protein
MKIRFAVLSMACGLLAWAAQAQDAADQPAPPSDTTAQDTSATDSTGSDAGTQAATGDVPTDSAPTGVAAAAPGGGLLSFQTDLFTGRFNYGIPIVVPPARGNSQPSIALGYTSAGGDGWCGVGWMLDMGYIQRDTRYGVPRAWSGNLPANYYDDSKGFVCSFGGAESRLVYIQTTGGDQEYRTEADTGAFLKFLWKSDGSWQVVDKGGNTYYFGTNSTSRMEAPFSGATVAQKTFHWSLCQAVDVNGNQTILSYSNLNNQLYLAQIKYNLSTKATFTGNTVDFNLTNRTDTTISFIPGYRVETRKLLKEIVVKAAGQNVRKYVLNYANSPSTGRSLVQSVTEYGTDFSTALPAMTFSYQVQSNGFGSLIDWPTIYSQNESNSDWNSIRATDTSKDNQVEFVDIDRDGLPDRVMRARWSPYNISFWCQLNTGSGFYPTTTNTPWGPLDSQGKTSTDWNSVRAIDGNNSTFVEFTDINNDGYPDRVMQKVNSPYNTFYVQTNTGVGFSSAFTWGPVTNKASSRQSEWNAVRDTSGGDTWVDFMDMNGDGLPDRIMMEPQSPYTDFVVQRNTGSGFGSMLLWTNVYSQGDTSQSWNSLYSSDGGGNTRAGLYDINGDGLPDRVMRIVGSGPYTQFVVQFNNGAGFETNEFWGGTIDGQGQSGNGWWSPVGADGATVFSTLVDINGDGLMDRVMRKATGPPYDYFVVQLNTGSGFASSVVWSNVTAEASGPEWRTITGVNSAGETKVDLRDINGDGLPDRVMRKLNAPYNVFKVQLNQGPCPDLMWSISNNMGGSVQISYAPSTTYSNRVAGLSLLSAPMWTVSKVIADDGVDHTGPNALTNSYLYAQGMYDYPTKEFRGFGKVIATDPAGGKSITYFHQGGGTNGTALGEYNDAGSHAKKGMAYRVEVYGGTGNTNLYSVTVNKVDETQVNAAGWYFAYVTQTVQKSYEGLTGITPKMTLKLFEYDTTTGNLTKESSLGEISAYTDSNHSYTDTGSDDVYTITHYPTPCNQAS